MEKFLECSNVKIMTSEAGVEYARAEFRPVVFKEVAPGIVKALYSGALSAGRIFNKEKAPQVGTYFEGHIEANIKTTEYTIGEGPNAKVVDSITVVCFADEKAWEVANIQLARHEASVLDKDGKPTVKPTAKQPKNQEKV